MKESEFWASIRPHLNSAEVHASRIENSAGTGISDVTACRRGIGVFLELKVFHGSRIHFRNSQRVWIKNRTDSGGRVLVVARKEDRLTIYDARAVVLVPTFKPGSDGKSFSIHEDDLPRALCEVNKPFDWNLVREVIFDPTSPTYLST